MGKLLMVFGVLIFFIGLMLTFKISIPLLGKLPGDIVLKGDNYQIYVPITTCIVLSILLSLLMYLFSSKS